MVSYVISVRQMLLLGRVEDLQTSWIARSSCLHVHSLSVELDGILHQFSSSAPARVGVGPRVGAGAGAGGVEGGRVMEVAVTVLVLLVVVAAAVRWW